MGSNSERRQFLKTMGSATLFLNLVQVPGLSLLGCASKAKNFTFDGADDLQLLPGLNYRVLIADEEKFGNNFNFGVNNDFLEWHQKSEKEFYLHVNHEHPTAFLQHGEKDKTKKTKAQVDLERASLGTSLLMMEKGLGGFTINKSSSTSFRLDATSSIPVAWGKKIRNKSSFTGTMANCAGGKTDWGTFLTCEENYDDFYGESKIINGKRQVDTSACRHGWERFYAEDPEQYGWVVEINPETKTAKKLISMGRFAHEGATFVRAYDGTPVVYMGDDKENEFLYKFIASKKDSLEEGRLYVANFEAQTWELLSLENPKLKKHFKNHTELLLQTRAAARLAGGTDLDRPEDVVQGLEGEIYVALTNNVKAGRPHGRIIELREEDPTALKFSAKTFLEGGLAAGFSCPDNFALDKKGNIWLTSDMTTSEIYQPFGRNALYHIVTSGEKRGQVTKIAQAPQDAEFTGPCFLPDGKSMLICVQHPGEKSDEKGFTSNWPHREKNRKPQSAVVEISGLGPWTG
jgi:secreted PhoX family phosphatase